VVYSFGPPRVIQSHMSVLVEDYCIIVSSPRLSIFTISLLSLTLIIVMRTCPAKNVSILNVSLSSFSLSHQAHLHGIDPLTILRYPRKAHFQVNDQLRRKIAAHLVTDTGYPMHFLLPLIPHYMESWGKVRIGDGGDYIHTKSTTSNQAGRDQSFVRVRFT
jgi:hypothetical protein